MGQTLISREGAALTLASDALLVSLESIRPRARLSAARDACEEEEEGRDKDEHQAETAIVD